MCEKDRTQRSLSGQADYLLGASTYDDSMQHFIGLSYAVFLRCSAKSASFDFNSS